jgi:DNA-binding MarR family transcriptional regulator
MNAKYKAAQALGELTLESFRLNARLLATGDELARDLQMTSARWQVLGTLVLAGEPVTVAEISRRMGLARQSVQRVTDGLAESKLVRFVSNPAHPRWNLVAPTQAGLRVHRKLEARRKAWAVRLVADIPAQDLLIAMNVLRKLRLQLAAAAL